VARTRSRLYFSTYPIRLCIAAWHLSFFFGAGKRTRRNRRFVWWKVHLRERSWIVRLSFCVVVFTTSWYNMPSLKVREWIMILVTVGRIWLDASQPSFLALHDDCQSLHRPCTPYVTHAPENNMRYRSALTFIPGTPGIRWAVWWWLRFDIQGSGSYSYRTRRTAQLPFQSERWKIVYALLQSRIVQCWTRHKIPDSEILQQQTANNCTWESKKRKCIHARQLYHVSLKNSIPLLHLRIRTSPQTTLGSS